MKRIAHVANLYGPKSGGLRTTVNELARQYSRRNIEVLVIVPGVQDKIQISDRIKFVELQSLRIPFSGGYRLILQTGKVEKLLEYFKPDMVEISDRSTLLRTARWAERRGIPTTIFVHERLDGVLRAFGSWLPFRNFIARRWNTLTARLTSKVVATTQFAAEEFVSLGFQPSFFHQSKLGIIPLGVDLEQFDPDQRFALSDFEFKVPHRYVMAATRMSKEKDPGFLLDIAEEVKAMGFDLPLVIAGSGPLEKKLAIESKNRNLNVIFAGFLHNRSKLASLLAGADVFLAVGPIETFGLAALESLASGTPVICRDSAAISEVIDSKCGIALPRDAQSWANQIARFREEDREKLRCSSRARAEAFSWNRCAENLIELHEETRAA